MVEGKSAILIYNYLIVGDFLSFSDFTRHFAPHKFLSITAIKAMVISFQVLLMLFGNQL